MSSTNGEFTVLGMNFSFLISQEDETPSPTDQVARKRASSNSLGRKKLSTRDSHPLRGTPSSTRAIETPNPRGTVAEVVTERLEETPSTTQTSQHGDLASKPIWSIIGAHVEEQSNLERRQKNGAIAQIRDPISTQTTTSDEPSRIHAASERLARGASSTGNWNPDMSTKGWAEMHNAAWDNDIELLGALISEGKPVGIISTDKLGLTPLHMTALAGSLEAAHLLIENGASIYEKDDKGNTPLDLAAMKGNISMMNAMIQTVKGQSEDLDMLKKAIHKAVLKANTQHGQRLYIDKDGNVQQRTVLSLLARAWQVFSQSFHSKTSKELELSDLTLNRA